MVKKEVQKRLTQRTMTEDEIIYYGAQKYVKRTVWLVALFTIIGAIIVSVVISIIEPIKDWWSLAGWIAFFVGWFVWWLKIKVEGRKFWNNIKDREEPISLDEKY